MSSTENVPSPSLRSRSIRGGAAVLVGQGLRFVLSFGSQIVLARLLDPAQFGIIAMISPVLGFVQIFGDLGLLQAVVQKENVTERELTLIFWITSGASLILTILMSLLAPVLAWVYGDQRVVAVTIVLSLLIFMTGTSQVQRALMTRRLQFSRLVVIDSVCYVLGITAGVAGAWAGYGYWSLVFNQVVNSCVYTLLCWIAARWRPSQGGAWREVGSMLKFGSHVTAARLIGYLNSSVDNVMIGVALGEVALGIYDRAWKLAVQPLNQITAPVDRIALPVLSRLTGTADRYRKAYMSMLEVLLLISTPGLMYAVVMAGPLISLLFGEKWLSTIPIFAWICLGAIVTPVNIGVFWLFTSQGRTQEQMNATLVASCINIAAYASGLAWGLQGVARASALSVYLLQTPFLIWMATRQGPVDLGAMLRAIYPVAFGLAVTAPLLHTLVGLLPGDEILRLAMALPICYALTYLLTAVWPDGRRALRTLVSIRSELRGMKPKPAEGR